MVHKFPFFFFFFFEKRFHFSQKGVGNKKYKKNATQDDQDKYFYTRKCNVKVCCLVRLQGENTEG